MANETPDWEALAREAIDRQLELTKDDLVRARGAAEAVGQVYAREPRSQSFQIGAETNAHSALGFDPYEALARCRREDAEQAVVGGSVGLQRAADPLRDDPVGYAAEAMEQRALRIHELRERREALKADLVSVEQALGVLAVREPASEPDEPEPAEADNRLVGKVDIYESSAERALGLEGAPLRVIGLAEGQDEALQATALKASALLFNNGTLWTDSRGFQAEVVPLDQLRRLEAESAGLRAESQS